MATFRKRGNTWQVRIQRKGYPDLTKTFAERNLCAQWARSVESELDRGVFINRSDAESTTFRELIIRYQQEVTPHKKGARAEHNRLNSWLKTPLADRIISTLRSPDFATWRDGRVKQELSANTIRLDLAVVSHLFNIAKSEWGFESLSNPIEHIRIPKLPAGRARRLTDTEIDLLIKHTESYELPYIIKIALETGMRRSEIANLEWRYIDFKKRTLLIPDTKNGDTRTIPLTVSCVAILKSIPRNINGRVFNITPHAISQAFLRARSRSDLDNLHFHDLRHEAVTRFFEKGLNVMEVGSISGHKTLAMLKRYTHLKAEDLAKKLG